MRRLLVIAVGLAVSAVALYLVLRSVDLAETGRIIAGADPLPLLATLPVVATQVALRTLRWRRLLAPFAGGRRLAVRRLAPVLLVGYLGNAVLPARLGEPIRAVVVSRREAIPVPESLGSAFLERIVDVATLGIVVLAAALLVEAPSWVIQATAVAAAGGTLLVAILALARPSSLLALVGRLGPIGRRRVFQVAIDRLARFVDALGSAHRGATILLAAAISSAAWVLDATTFWLVGQSLGIELSAGAAMLIAGVTVLGTAVPSAPGYVGTFELAAATTAVALGVPEAAALGLAVVAHAVTLLPVAIGGAVSTLALGVRLREVADEASSTRAGAAHASSESVRNAS